MQRPYCGNNRKEIRDKILSKQVQINKEDAPPKWTIESIDFINKLLIRKPEKRLGSDGPGSVKNHPWLVNYNWDSLHNMTLISPFEKKIVVY
jgi:serine/threonine kinase 32